MNKQVIIWTLLLLVTSIIFIIGYSSAAYPTFTFGHVDFVFTNWNYRATLINTTVISPNNSINYWDVKVIGILKNNGTMATGSSTAGNAMSRIGSNSGGGQAISIQPLLAGEKTKVSLSFVGYTGQYSVGFDADVRHNVTESNEANNQIRTLIILP